MKPIRPAERLNNVSEYYFSKKLKEVAALNAAGKNIISLGIGSPDLPPSPEAIKVLSDQAALPNTHGYQPYNGLPELRKAFATWYETWYGVTLNPDTE
ncbi:MAG: aminotransferase class I/II-fold pyridoxal phosphate-dependent enzyme, partial [Bacteroidales bacterium]|nr:aminotransferase class I/II-fold pyridoxal phosphate-dependent enzyme [Bacteroidales bacterium]